MNWFSSMGIGKRLYAASALLSTALAGVALFTHFELTGVVDLAEQAESSRIPQMQRIAAVELNLTHVSLQLRHAMLSRTPEEMNAALAELGDKRKLVEQTLVDYEKGLFTPEGKERFAKVAPVMAKFWDAGQANVKLVQDGQKAEAFALLVDKTIPARNEVLTILSDTVKFQQTALRDELATIRLESRRTMQTLIGLVCATIVGLGLFSWYVAGVLRRRVATSCQVAERVRDGNLTVAVHDDARDEFTPLLAVLADMQSSLTRVVTDVRNNSESVAT